MGVGKGLNADPKEYFASGGGVTNEKGGGACQPVVCGGEGRGQCVRAGKGDAEEGSVAWGWTGRWRGEEVGGQGAGRTEGGELRS